MGQEQGWKVVGTWFLCILLALVFLSSGGLKLVGMEMHVENFARWGFPQWFRLVVGAAEVVAALLLLIPKLARYGAVILVVVMIGAIGTHAVNDEWVMIAPPLVLGSLAALAGWARRNKPEVQAN